MFKFFKQNFLYLKKTVHWRILEYTDKEYEEY